MSVDVMVVVVKIVIILLCLTLMIRQNIKYIQRTSFTYMVHFYFLYTADNNRWCK